MATEISAFSSAVLKLGQGLLSKFSVKISSFDFFKDLGGELVNLSGFLLFLLAQWLFFNFDLVALHLWNFTDLSLLLFSHLFLFLLKYRNLSGRVCHHNWFWTDLLDLRSQQRLCEALIKGLVQTLVKEGHLEKRHTHRQ
jgi:hypothetical protein